MGKTAKEILSGNYRGTDWIIDELLPVGLCLAGGAPKAGKSWLFLQVARSVASGEPFLGYKVESGCVEYWALEDSVSRLAERMRVQGWSQDKFGELFVLFHTMDEIRGNLLDKPLRDPPDGVSLVIIDTLSAAFGGNQVAHAKVRQLFMDLRDYAHKYEVCVVVVDHRGKSGSIFGSVAKLAFADAIWTLDKDRIEIEGKDTKISGVDVKFENGIWSVAEDEMLKEEMPKYKDLIQYDKSGVYTLKLSRPVRGRVSVEMERTTKGLLGDRRRSWSGRVEIKELVNRIKGAKGMGLTF